MLHDCRRHVFSYSAWNSIFKEEILCKTHCMQTFAGHAEPWSSWRWNCAIKKFHQNHKTWISNNFDDPLSSFFFVVHCNSLDKNCSLDQQMMPSRPIFRFSFFFKSFIWRHRLHLNSLPIRSSVLWLPIHGTVIHLNFDWTQTFILPSREFLFVSSRLCIALSSVSFVEITRH